jgi:carbonic anhydrase
MIQDLFDNNVAWARRQIRGDPDFFRRLAELQHPEYLWIGCSDSRVPASTITGLAPGEVFVHRNVANLVREGDLNCLAVLQFSIQVLQIKHIIVCGHYGCGGIRAAVHPTGLEDIDRWLEPVRETAVRFAPTLAPIVDEETRLDLLCERNIEAQVGRLAGLAVVQDAWARGQPLSIHGWVYRLKDGLLRNLECTRRSPVAASPGHGRPAAPSGTASGNPRMSQG